MGKKEKKNTEMLLIRENDQWTHPRANNLLTDLANSKRSKESKWVIGTTKSNKSSFSNNVHKSNGLSHWSDS